MLLNSICFRKSSIWPLILTIILSYVMCSYVDRFDRNFEMFYAELHFDSSGHVKIWHKIDEKSRTKAPSCCCDPLWLKSIVFLIIFLNSMGELISFFFSFCWSAQFQTFRDFEWHFFFPFIFCCNLDLQYFNSLNDCDGWWFTWLS